MKLESSKLKTALANLGPIFKGRQSLPILSCVKLHTERNRLHITASNLDEFMVERIECDEEIASTCVSYSHLKLSIFGDEVEIKIQKESVVIKCGIDETKISTRNTEEFPLLPKFEKPSSHGVSCADLAASVGSVSWASSTDDSRYMLQSVLVESEAKSLRCIATNGRELAIAESALIGSVFQVVIPSAFVTNLSSALDRVGASFSSTTNYVKVAHEWGNYFCKQMEGNYPNYKAVIPTKSKPLGRVNVSDLKNIVSQCVGFAAQGEARGVFKFAEKELEIEFEGDGGSKLSRHLAGEFSPLTIALSTRKMLAVLNNATTETAELLFTDELSPLVLKSGDLMVATMPMRLA